MKKLHKLLAVLLTMILILESFAVTALATAPETEIAPEPATVPEKMLTAIQAEPAAGLIAQEETEPEESEEPEQEAEILYSGTCGEKLTWTLDSNGLLVISGKGKMTDYSSKGSPWYKLDVEKVIVESGVTSIGNYAFQRGLDAVANVTEVILPDTLLHIGEKAFIYSSIEEIYIPNSVTTIYDFAFSRCEQLKVAHISKKMTTLNEGIFDGCYSLESIVIPESITTIGFAAFRDCYALKDFSFPSKLKTIKEQAFSECRSLKVLVIPNSVTRIDRFAFTDCNSLQLVYLPNKLTTISERLFSRCVNLEAIFMPGSVTLVESGAFAFCYDFSEVYYLGTEAQFRSLRVYTDYNEALLNADWYLATIATKHPKDVTTTAGKTVTFSTASSRSNTKYQWYYLAPGSEEWVPCSGSSAKKATYSFTAKASMDGYQYCCLMTDTYGSQFTSNSALLTIVPAPTITKQPEDVMVKIGEEATVTVEAEGEELTYTWYYAAKGSSKYSKSSTTGNTYSTTMTKDRDGRKVYCVVKDKYGQSVKSETATLYRETTPLVITQQPESVTAKYGETVTLTAEATGDDVTYTWYYASKGSSKFSKTTTGKTYTTTMTKDRDGRQLYCLIKDTYGKSVKTEVVTLTIDKVPLKMIAAPESVTVKNGETATVTVEAEGDGLTYTWYYASRNSNKFTKSETKGNTYSTTMKKDLDGRKVYCVIKDTYGQSIKTDVVTLNLDKTPLVLVTAPESVTVKNGEKASVSVEAQGDGLTYTWYYASRNSNKFTKSETKGSTYSTTMNKDRDGRKVYCVIKDTYGQSIKTDVVTVYMEKTPLVIVQQPESVTVANGEAVSVTVVAEGDGLTYHWYYASATASKFTKSETKGNTYCTTMNADRDGRRLYCIIKDTYGQSVKTEVISIHMG